MKKIIDQYTDRSDLSGYQKWALRHPEAAWSRRYLNLDNRIEHNKRSIAKKKVLAIRSRHAGISKAFLEPHKSRQTILREREIIQLHTRGKDIGSIAIWMNLPVSIISSVLNQNL